MPRIKNDVDLKELLNYGFVETFPNCYCSTICINSTLNNYIRIIIKEDKEIIFRGKNKRKKNNKKWIRNLIKAGLVDE